MFHYSYILVQPLAPLGPPDELRRVLGFLRECGYEGVEFNLTEPLGFDPDLMERWTAELGLVVPALLTGEAYREGLCLTSPDAEVRQRTVQRLITYVDVARRFNSILVLGLLQGLRSDEPDTETAIQRIADCMRQVAAAAERQGVEIVFEPVNHLQVGFNNTVGEVLSLIERVGSDAIKPMVDTIHLNIEERSLVQPILDCGPTLRHVHLAESNASLFGTGHIDFGSVLKALDQIGYDRFVSMKVYRGAALEEGARTSIGHLRTLAAT